MGFSCKISLKPIHWFYPLVSHFFKWIQTVFKKCQGLNTCPLYIFVSFLNMKVIAIARVIKLLSLSWSLKPYYPMVLQGGASELANLVNITPMSLGFMEDIYIYWLVVWNISSLSIYWEVRNPNWRTHIFFQRARSTTNQYNYSYHDL